MTDYHPIACATYAELELAILRRKALRIGWRDCDHTRHLAMLRPRNLITRDHAEYLIAEDRGGSELEIRLDRIIRFTPINPCQD
ncbi:MAG TPA: transcriptional antiterminator, Rof [Nitrococcus sp.]|nr:transcriptional antiterminator, Rof [Nitrococcus sp.]